MSKLKKLWIRFLRWVVKNASKELVRRNPEEDRRTVGYNEAPTIPPK